MVPYHVHAIITKFILGPLNLELSFHGPVEVNCVFIASILSFILYAFLCLLYSALLVLF
jgi:hypothetical protein